MRLRTAALALTAAAVLALSGCAGSDSASTTEFAAPGDVGGAMGEPMAPDAMRAPAEGPVAADGATSSNTGSSSTVMTREVVRTGTMSLQADDVAATVARVRALTAAAQGFVSAENTSTAGDDAYSTITVQVPAAKLDAFVDSVSTLGTVQSLDLTSQDVTSQAVDLDARIKALQTSVARMTDLLAQASDVSDLMAIEAQLSSRQAELDAMTAQRTWLREQVAMSTLSVSVSEVPTVEAVPSPGFASGLESGWAAFVSAVGVTATAFGFFLPFLLFLLVIAVPVALVCVWLVRRHRRRLSAVAPQPVGTHSASADLTAQP